MTKKLTHTLKQNLRLAGHARWFRAFAALVILASLAFPALTTMNDLKAYALTPEVEKVLGEANKNLSAKFSFDKENNTWKFNKEGAAAQANAIAKQQGGDVDGVAAALTQLKAKQIGGGGKEDKSLYSADLPVNAKEGITYYDNQTNLSFKMIPSFPAKEGKLVQGRVVYPFTNGGQIVYTAKSNGIKEDIVLSKYIGDSLRYGYTLELPETLEARTLEDGSIGIYSADPSLFGNISFGGDTDKAKVMDARKNGSKNNMVFGIPAPFIKDQNGKAGHTKYVLDGNKLDVYASDLKELSYPLAIDPSVTVTSSTEFTAGNNEGMIDFGTDQINRGEITGGTTGVWDNAGGTTFANARDSAQTVAYNGYIYYMGGNIAAGGSQTLIHYAAVGSDGNVGAWQQATNTFTTIRSNFGAVAYNGYMYVMGGFTNFQDFRNDVQYAPINANGSLGTWQYTYNSASSATQTGGFTSARYGHTSAVYNGYMYVMGGCTGATGTCSAVSNDVQYAPINANGTIGSWANANNTGTLFTTRAKHTSAVYNGYMYVMGGFTSKDVFNNLINQTDSVQYAAIGSDGKLGAWASLNNLNAAQYDAASVVHNGYLYVIGGKIPGGSNGNTTTDVRYAQINANGTLGAWGTTNAFDATGRYAHGAASYKGYLYVVGGCNNVATNCNAGASYTNNVRKAKINTAGALGSYGAEANFDTAERQFFASVAYNNYIYVIGGTTGNTGAQGAMVNTTRYAPVNSDGSVGTWNTATTGFSNTNSGVSGQTCGAGCPGRVNMAAGVHNGYLYIAGGVSNGGASDHWSDVQSAVICTGVNLPVAGCAGQGDLRNWSTLYTDYLTNSTTTYTEANGRSRVAMQIYNGKMYLLGGNNNGTLYSHIYTSTLTNTGGAGAFSLSSVALPSARSGVSTFVHGGNLYIVGGGAGSSWAQTNSDQADVQFIPINTDGTLNGTIGWKDANLVGNGGSGSSFATVNGLNSYGVSESNGQIYISGGFAGGTFAGLTTVHRASINANGSLGAWGTTTSFTTARLALKTVAVKGHLYVIGGCSQLNFLAGNFCTSDAARLTTYQHAPIHNGGNGAPVSWASGTTFTGARYYHSTVASNGYLYVIGGCTAFTAGPGCTAVASDYSYAPINNDGSLGAWTQVTGVIPSAVYNMGSVVVNGHVYLIGGCGAGACSTYRNIVQYAPINSNGSLGTWGSPGTGGTFDGAMAGRWGTAAAYYDGYIYTVGGAGSGGTLSDVWSAPVNADGTLGAWQSAGSGFTTARYIPGSVAHKGYLYVIGGHSDVGATSVYNDIQFRPIGSSGTLSGSWTTTRNFPEAAGAINVTAYNGYMYLSGGYTSASTATSSTRYAPISPNGHLERWNIATGYTTARAATGGAIYNGYMYVTGGYLGTPFNATDYASIQVQSRIGRYSKLLQVPSTVDIASVHYNGSIGTGSVTYKVAPSNGIFTSSGTAQVGTGSEPTPKCGSGDIYYVQIFVTMDDTLQATFADVGSSSISDITVYYRINATPTPNLRLTGGKWFYNQQQQPHDICRP